jgi:hypothetical protein
MRMTLLDMTQNILSALDSDEVNSISDTTESVQVAGIIKTSFFNITSRSSLPVQTELFQLDSSLDLTQPVLMYRPDHVAKMQWIKYYDTSVSDNDDNGGHDINLDIIETTGTTSATPQYKYVTIIPIQQFLDRVNTFNVLDSNTFSWSFQSDNGNYNFFYKNNKQPQYCTVLQNYYIIFDGYDATQDSTLQTSKTMCYGEISPEWSMTDTFIPDLDDQQFPLLLNEAKSLAFLELKQMSHPKADQEVKRQWSTLQKDKSLTDKPTYFNALPNFGRTGSNIGNAPGSFFKARGWDNQ